MRRLLLVTAVAATLVACTSRERAVQAIAEAEQVITDVHAYALRNAPDEFKTVMDEYRAAREQLAAGEYRAAVRSARKAAGLARSAGRAANTSRQDLEAEWTTLRDSVAAVLRAIDERITELTRSPSLSRGITDDQVAAAKAAGNDLADALWQATQAAERREFRDAVHAATRLKARADQVMASLAANQKSDE